MFFMVSYLPNTCVPYELAQMGRIDIKTLLSESTTPNYTARVAGRCTVIRFTHDR